MNAIITLLAFLAAALLSACTTQPTASSAATASRLIESSTVARHTAPGKTEVRLIRDVGMIDAGVKAAISLTGGSCMILLTMRSRRRARGDDQQKRTENYLR
jgi:hypothetical protein